jgi:methionyl-tRNA synthetase
LRPSHRNRHRRKLLFPLSALHREAAELCTKQPDFIQPESRRNEVIASSSKALQDLSISRTTIKWGIPVPDEAEARFYVWFDALTTT